MNIAICSLALGAEYQQNIGLCTQTQEEYAQFHGYTRITDESVYDSSRPFSWSKILLIKKYLSEYDYLLWMDADVMVTNINFKLDSYVMEPEKFMMIGIELNDINAGVFLIRNCDRSFEFLDKVWTCSQYIQDPWCEQAAMIHLLPQFTDMQIISREDSHTFNSYDPSTEPVFPWTSGDFAIHFTGKRDDELLQLQKAYWDMRLPKADCTAPLLL